jgi:hypothetical protein
VLRAIRPSLIFMLLQRASCMLFLGMMTGAEIRTAEITPPFSQDHSVGGLEGLGIDCGEKRSLEDELRLLAESCLHFRIVVADSKRHRCRVRRGEPHIVQPSCRSNNHCLDWERS